MPVSGSANTETKETPSLIRKKPIEKSPDESNKEQKPILEERNTPFSDEDLSRVWEAFKDNMLEKASDTEKLILGRKLIKSEGDNVKLLLESQLETSILEKFEGDLIQFLRKQLDNTLINIEKEVSEQEQSKNLYTSKEKFEYMVQQNPELRKLKDRLGLDFEY